MAERDENAGQRERHRDQQQGERDGGGLPGEPGPAGALWRQLSGE